MNSETVFCSDVVDSVPLLRLAGPDLGEILRVQLFSCVCIIIHSCAVSAAIQAASCTPASEVCLILRSILLLTLLTDGCLFSEGAQTPSPLGRYPPALSNGPIGHSSPHLGRRQIDRDDYFHSYPHGRSFHNY